MSAPAPLSPWTAELAFRARQLFWLKFLSTTLWTSVFFVGYFHVLRNPVYPVTEMPLIWVDAWVPFQPAIALNGISYNIARSFGPAIGGVLVATAGAVFAYGANALAYLPLMAIFYFWPTAVPPLDLDRSAHPGFAMLQGVDANGNACPSMHVAASVFTAVRVHAVLREIGAPTVWRWANLAWVLLIAWSTMAVRQHVALDVLGGVLLGLAFAFPSLRWRPASYHPRPFLP